MADGEFKPPAESWHWKSQALLAASAFAWEQLSLQRHCMPPLGMYQDENTTEIIKGCNYTDEANYTGNSEECLGVISVKCKVVRLWDFQLPELLIQGGLTFWTSEGTLLRKSSTSLFSTAYGFRNFLVNLLIPKTEMQSTKLNSSYKHVINTSLLGLSCIYHYIIKEKQKQRISAEVRQ